MSSLLKPLSSSFIERFSFRNAGCHKYLRPDTGKFTFEIAFDTLIIFEAGLQVGCKKAFQPSEKQMTKENRKNSQEGVPSIPMDVYAPKKAYVPSKESPAPSHRQ